MNLYIKRITKNPYCVGHLYINDKYFCDTLEPPYFGTTQNTPIQEIKNTKKGNTAIPIGTYDISLDYQSPKFKNRNWAKFCDGYLPTIMNVPAFNRILIHVGNIASQYGKSDTMGCILVGMNLERGKVLKSQETFKKLYKVLSETKLKGENIQIIIR